jgi:hypothetical protein
MRVKYGVGEYVGDALTSSMFGSATRILQRPTTCASNTGELAALLRLLMFFMTLMALLACIELLALDLTVRSKRPDSQNLVIGGVEQSIRVLAVPAYGMRDGG